MQLGPGTLEEISNILLIILVTTGILCSFRLVPQRKVDRDLPE